MVAGFEAFTPPTEWEEEAPRMVPEGVKAGLE
jgi:hypothetical protein